MTVTVVNFGSGQNVTMVTIPLMGDSVYKGPEFETFTVGLRATGVGEVNIGDVSVVTVRLTENDGENFSYSHLIIYAYVHCIHDSYLSSHYLSLHTFNTASHTHTVLFSCGTTNKPVYACIMTNTVFSCIIIMCSCDGGVWCGHCECE